MDYPYICKFYEAFLDHKYVHLVVEYCKDGDLYSKLELVGRFKEADAKRIVRQCLLALSHLHSQNIAHRDVKLENILVNGEDIKLIDFGISLLMSNSH